ncbi:glycosyltransferase family 4 protein [Advenella sp. RU8]|uniref:glycosyltransferase family 4 protein n=1 Tax=Advenella sp. RU8 TaxID=3399575 RepID=UPI003AAEAF2E
MKIMLLVSSMNAGGAERVAATLANAWVRQGHHVVLVPCFSKGSGQSFYPLHADVQVKWLADDLPRQKWLGRISKPLVLRKRIKAEQPEVIVSFLTNVNVTTLLATRGMDIPVIVCERTHPVVSKNIGRVLKVLRQKLYPVADAVMIQTEDAARSFAQVLPGLKHVAVIPNPLPDGIEQVTTNNGLCSVSGRKTLVAMGRLVPAKQFDLLIEVFSTLCHDYPDWDLCIWGDGPQRTTLIDKVKKLGCSQRISLPGKTTEPWQALSHAHAFVMTSRVEGFPNVLLEAMALGLPSISFDCPSGPAELTQQGSTGLLVRLNDRLELEKAIRRFLGDDDFRCALGARGKQSVWSRYRLETVLKQWDDLFRQVGAPVSGKTET